MRPKYDSPKYDWDEAYEAAILETDRWKVNAAQAAIDRRLQEMPQQGATSPVVSRP